MVRALKQTKMSCHDAQAQVIAHGLSSEAAIASFDALPMIDGRRWWQRYREPECQRDEHRCGRHGRQRDEYLAPRRGGVPGLRRL